MLNLLYADSEGRMYDNPDLVAVGRTGGVFAEIDPKEIMPLPEGASLVMIPEGTPVGIDKQGNFKAVKNDIGGKGSFAVGALLPQGFTRTLLPAFHRVVKKNLPLFGYAAVGWKDDQVYVAAVPTDDAEKWNPRHYSTRRLGQLVEGFLKEHPENRIMRQLSMCALKYSCFTAQNIFYRRWEGGIPVSPTCNANCLGCISLQPAECCPSPQSRIKFKPAVEEIVEIALPHLKEAEDGIISFGQGCEGEPALAADTIAEAIIRIRKQTASGTINMNTNAGYTEGIKRICTAGIDSLRVSTVGVLESSYQAYYRPRSYKWQDVCASIEIARNLGVFVSLNLLTFPGLTDQQKEVDALIHFIRRYDINMVQIRNLNIDPDFLLTKVQPQNEESLGITGLINELRENIPNLIIGNFSKPLVK